MKKFVIFAFIFFLATLPLVGSAQLVDQGLSDDMAMQNGAFEEAAGLNSGIQIGDVAFAVIRAFLSLLGIIFIILIIIAGYNWMMSSGDESKVTKSKDTLRAAIIGLIITLAAYAITYWVFNSVPFGDSGGYNPGGGGWIE